MNSFPPKRVLLGCMYALAAATTSVSAQTSEGDDTPRSSASAPGEIAEIVVTANKREQNLSDVGLSVTAISAATLAERKITSLQDVAQAVPGLAFSQSQTNTPILTLRGVGYNNNSLGAYPAVSVYIDQAPLPFSVLAGHTAFDLERIEVLKGPQGTLFGENSTGGAINYIAAKPTKNFAAGGDLDYGRFNRIEGSAYISGPITDTLQARLAVDSVNSDGWQISETRPYDRNGKQSYIAGRFLLAWQPSEGARFTLNLNGWEDTSEPQSGQFIMLRAQAATVLPEELVAPFSAGNPRSTDWTLGNVRPRLDRKLYQTSLRGDVNITNDLVLTWISSYVHMTQDQASDEDGLALEGNDFSKVGGNIRSFTQELRVANQPTSRFRWMIGGNFDDTHTLEDQLIEYPFTGNDNAMLNFIHRSEALAKQRINQYAGFASTEYDVSQELTAKLSGRYTESDNSATLCDFDAGDGNFAGLFNSFGYASGYPFTPVGFTGPFETRCTELNTHFVPNGKPTFLTLNEHNVSWRAGLDYHIDPRALLYVNVSRGYKAGSFPVLGASSTLQWRPVSQESVTDYEIGVKTSFFDRSLLADAAAFYYDYKNKQILAKVYLPPFGIEDGLVNVPKSRVYGAEANVTIRPVSGLTLGGNVTYLGSRIQSYTGVNLFNETQNFAGSRLPFAPEWSYGLSAEYRYTAGGSGSPFIGIDVTGSTETDTTVDGRDITIPPALTTRILPGLEHPFTTNGYALVNARVGYESAGGQWRVMVWGKNIFNKYYWTNVITASDFTSKYAGMPATFGVTIGFKL
jgi:outer membrane receptor protein involved in Fe transport